jgi:hypothetical protein
MNFYFKSDSSHLPMLELFFYNVKRDVSGCRIANNGFVYFIFNYEIK